MAADDPEGVLTMGRSPSITIGDARDGIRVEHVKGRGMVRLVRWAAGRVEDDWVGLEVSDFCTRLGLTTDVLGPSSAHYLLVAGAERPGAGHVVSLFDSEEDARAAFVTVRRSDPGAEAWAEVTKLSGGEVRRLCWFGTPAASSHPKVGPNGDGAERTKWHDRMLGRILHRGNGSRNPQVVKPVTSSYADREHLATRSPRS